MPGSRKDRLHQGRYPCVVCSTQVTIHQKALQCDNCDEWTHFKCTPLTCEEYSDLAKSSKDWYCANCEAICTQTEGEQGAERSGGAEEEVVEEVNGGGENVEELGPASEELLAMFEDDFMKDLGNLVDVLKQKFEHIHRVQQQNKQLTAENRNLKQQLADQNEEILNLQQKLSQLAEPQAEIRRLNSVIRAMKQSVSRGTDACDRSRESDSLVDRQSRMATVLGRMTSFLSGLTDDLTRNESFLPTSSSSVPSRPSSADDQNDRPKPKKFKRSL